jgi:NAD(P)-dependent dehydrogenase (short-subunit alcohol dehydrogenase family)
MADCECLLDTEVHMEIFDTVAVVSGSDTMLGSAVASLLESQGARVAGLRTDSSGPGKNAFRQPELSVAVNIMDSQSIEDAFQRIKATLGPPRILVNCHVALARFPIAAIDSDRNVAPCSLKRCESIITSNLIGTFDISRLFVASAVELPPLGGGERGVLINTAADPADDGAVNEAALAAAMGGLVAMSLPLARELGRYGIRALSVIAADFEESAPGGTQQAFSVERAFPPRRGEPREFAEVIASLISNPMMNGTTVRLDGGGHRRPVDTVIL